MKNLLILSLLLLGFTFSACGQKTAPDAVTKAFAQKYATAKSVKWDNESATEWEAEFKMNGKEMTATYDNSGKWLESEAEISPKELPTAISTVLAKEFAGYKVGEMSTVESPEIGGFEVALKKGESNLEVVFSKDGKILKKTELNEENEKEEK